MSVGMKNKIEELIGKVVTVDYFDGSVHIDFPGYKHTILQIDANDCIVYKDIQDNSIYYMGIDKIIFIRLR